MAGSVIQHLEAGFNLLQEKGFSTGVARVALHHEDWNNPDRSLEELLVSLSDLWFGISFGKTNWRS